VRTAPPGRFSDRTEKLSPEAPLVDRATVPPGAAAAVRAAELPVRDGVREDEFDVEIRLGVREELDSDPPELDDDELEPPLELELDDPELPPELDPDDPDEPDDPDDPDLDDPRGTAWAPARPGAASAKAMTRLRARRVDLAMVVTPEVSRKTSSYGSGCNSTATR
jgi:hypothetical protein